MRRLASLCKLASTTMNNETVEACLIDRFLRMQFIVPADGGIIIVGYPFIFKVGE
ncbi:MAG: hypothetical protein KTR31_37815 [Myxococcales bacterium]|nr:hypothetical protein [Myxococcales bacterium]